jgi:hypothetical protein
VMAIDAKMADHIEPGCDARQTGGPHGWVQLTISAR